MHLVDLDFSQLFVFWFVMPSFARRQFGWISSPCASVLFFEVHDHCLSCSKEAAIMSTSSAKRRFDMQSLFFIIQCDAPFSFQVSMSFSVVGD